MSEAFARVGRWMSLKGRCSRALFAWFAAFQVGCFLAALLMVAILQLPLLVTLEVLIVALAAPGVIMSIRRLHDTGLSGWFVLACLIPVVGTLFSGAILFKRGQVGANRFGDDPLRRVSKRPSRPGVEWAFAALGGVMILALPFAVRTLAFQPFTIPSLSMEPNIHRGDYVVVSKAAYGWSRHAIMFGPKLFTGRLFFHPPARGDLVVFKLPRDGRTDYIKRMIGLPGDHIQVRHGLVVINGTPVTRSPARPGVESLDDREPMPVARFKETLPDGRAYMTNNFVDNGPADNTGVYVVPPHCYFMLGDDRDNAADSRFDPAIPPDFSGATCPWDPSLDALAGVTGLGFVPEENLVGKAVLAVALTGKPRLRWVE